MSTDLAGVLLGGLVLAWVCFTVGAIVGERHERRRLRGRALGLPSNRRGGGLR